MTGPSRAGRGRAPQQPWGPEPGKGVTCPSCGLPNDAGARVCRNCGLPIASEADPLRGVSPGRLDIPGVRNSGISAAVGLVAVVAVLILAGVLVVGGDSVLRRGGLIFGGGSDASPAPGSSRDPGAVPDPGATDAAVAPAQIGTTTDFSCEAVQIRDPEKSKWDLANVEGGVADGFEQVKVFLKQRSGRVRDAATVRTEWMTPDEAVARYQIPRPAGSRALALTFVGDVSLDRDRTLDASAMEAQGLDYLRSVQVTTDPEDRTIAIVGMNTDGCARLSSPKWKQKGSDRSAVVLLDVQTP